MLVALQDVLSVPYAPQHGLLRPPQYQEKGKMEVANPQNMISMNGIILDSLCRPPGSLLHQCLHSLHR